MKTKSHEIYYKDIEKNNTCIHLTIEPYCIILNTFAKDDESSYFIKPEDIVKLELPPTYKVIFIAFFSDKLTKYEIKHNFKPTPYISTVTTPQYTDDELINLFEPKLQKKRK